MGRRGVKVWSKLSKYRAETLVQERGLRTLAPGSLCGNVKGSLCGTSLVVQWLRLHGPNAGGLVQSLVRELDPACRPQLKEAHATTKTRHSQINK